MPVIQTEILLDDYYANLHGAYNSMRECFATCGSSQDDIAESLDIDKSLVSRRLNGTENLTLKTLSYMGTAMGCRLQVNFMPYATIGTTNTYTSTQLSISSTTPSPTSIPANPSRVLESM
jgi:transcriptional regulator with XRE-family HTH domain